MLKKIILSFLLSLIPIIGNTSLTIYAVGDVLLHKKLQNFGNQHGYLELWQPIANTIRQADISYANLEGPIAENIHLNGQYISTPKSNAAIYTSYPRFNYPPTLAQALKNSGFDIVSTANNHCLDRFNIGITKTIEALNQVSLLFIGTKLAHQPFTSFIRYIHKKDITTAWIACTQDTNGMADKQQQVLYCFTEKHREKILNLIQKARQNADVVIVTPHWGQEYQAQPNRLQIHYAKRWLEAGADIILGSHPHTVQPFTTYQTKDGRQTLIAYSLGNFISNQGSLKNRASGILAIQLVKNNKRPIQSIHYYPTYMQNRGGKMQLEWVTNKHSQAYQKLKQTLGKDWLTLHK